MTVFTDQKAKRSENAPNNQTQSLIETFDATILCTALVEMTLLAQSNVELYEIAHFL